MGFLTNLVRDKYKKQMDDAVSQAEQYDYLADTHPDPDIKGSAMEALVKHAGLGQKESANLMQLAFAHPGLIQQMVGKGGGSQSGGPSSIVQSQDGGQKYNSEAPRPTTPSGAFPMPSSVDVTTTPPEPVTMPMSSLPITPPPVDSMPPARHPVSTMLPSSTSAPDAKYRKPQGPSFLSKLGNFGRTALAGALSGGETVRYDIRQRELAAQNQAQLERERQQYEMRSKDELAREQRQQAWETSATKLEFETRRAAALADAKNEADWRDLQKIFVRIENRAQELSNKYQLPPEKALDRATFEITGRQYRQETSDKSVQPFEVWRQQNPDAPVSDWLKLESENRPERAPKSLQDIEVILKGGGRRMAFFDPSPDSAGYYVKDPKTGKLQDITDQVAGQYHVPSAMIQVAGATRADSGMPQDIRTALERATLGTQPQKRLQIFNTVNDMFTRGDVSSVKETIRQAALESDPVDVRNQVLARRQALRSLGEIETLLKGVPTDLKTGTIESIYRKLGTSHDPRYVDIANRLAVANQSYRRGMTGVAFSPAEAKQYAEIFPSFSNETPVNETLIRSLKDAFGSNDAAYWDYKLGPGWSDVEQPLAPRTNAQAQPGAPDAAAAPAAAPPKTGDTKDYNGATYRFNGRVWQKVSK